MSFIKNIRLFTLILGLSAYAHAQIRVDNAASSLPKDQIDLPKTLDYELEKLLEKWYEGYERKGVRPVLPPQAISAPNVPDSVYIDLMNRIPSAIRLSYNPLIRESIELYLFRRRPLLSSMLSLADLYFPDIETELDRHGLPLELKYLTIVESALNPTAISPAGAGGLWQFMLPTARIYGLTINSLVDERMDPIKGTEAACKMLKELYSIYKDWWLAMAAYNCGPGNVNRALARLRGGDKSFWNIYPYLPRETRKYVPLFIGVYFAMHYAEMYGIQARELGRTLATEYYEVNQQISFEKIAGLTGISVEQIKAFNPQFRRGIIPGNTEPYQIRLPLKAVLALEGYKPEEIQSYELSVVEEGVQGQSASYVASDSKYVYHRVSRGETVNKIARKYGVTVRDIRAWNTNIRKRGLKRGQRIIVGVMAQELKMPQRDSIASKELATVDKQQVASTPEENKEDKPIATTKVVDKQKAKSKSPTFYKVKRGDTPSVIAKKHGISLKQLREWNNLKGDRIDAGDKLKVSE